MDRRPSEREMAGRQIGEAAGQSAQQPVRHAQLNEEQQHDQFVESGKDGGVGLAVVGINEAGQRKSHLHAADLTGNLSSFEDELQSQPEQEADRELAE